jgi:hypothetical protein
MPLTRYEGDAPHFVDNLIAVHIPDRDNDRRESIRREVEDVLGAPRANSETVLEVLGEDVDDGVTGLDRVLGYVDMTVVPRPDAAAVALTRNPRVIASPVHALGFKWHRALGATAHEDATGTTFEDVDAPDDRIIAIVDTGICDPDNKHLPSWMTDGLSHDAIDIDPIAHPQSVSHGTFVASLLRQMAPTHSVSMARAGGYGDATDTESHPEPQPTTELHVADAIHRLIERHGGDKDNVDALNLSVGGMSLGDLEMATLRSAIERWRAEFPSAPVFAAGGNTTSPRKVYPAALRSVRGVAAANRRGEQIVWEDGQETDPVPPNRSWVDDVAPGSGLLGLSGVENPPAIKWSGSSFAAAVATACYVSGGPFETLDRLTYWPDKAMTYGNVSGLQFA